MNNGFSSYVHGQDDVQPQPQEAPSRVQVNVRDTVHYSTIGNDGTITDHASGHTKVTSSDLNPWKGSDSFAATAQHPNGTPASELAPDTLVTIGGIQAPIQFFLNQGQLQKAADGTITEASGKAKADAQATPEADSGDVQPIAEAEMSIVNAAIEAVPQGNMDGLFAAGAAFMTGRASVESLTQKFSQATGMGQAQSAEQLQVVADVYSNQAAKALTGYGILGTEMADFHQWAMKNAPDQLHAAILKQVHGHDVSGYRALAQSFQTSVVPPIEAFRKAGVPVRQQGNGSEVFIQGSWMTPKAAVKAGLC